MKRPPPYPFSSILAPGEKTESGWYESSYDSYERTTGAIPLPFGRGLRAGKEGQSRATVNP